MSVFIRLSNGQDFHPETATEADIDLQALVHSIAQLPRWHGHQRRFVSVAEHSVLVALCVAFDLGRPELGKQALLHDLHEGVSGGDVPAPYKRLPEFQGLVEFEKRIAAITRRAFGLPEELDEAVHAADRIVRATEAVANMVGSTEDFGLREPPSKLLALQFWDSDTSEKRFMHLFELISSDEARGKELTWHERMVTSFPELAPLRQRRKKPDELREEISKRLEIKRQKEDGESSPKPRYDHIYHSGVAWLDKEDQGPKTNDATNKKSAEELFCGIHDICESMVGCVYRHLASGVEYVVESVGLDEESPSRRLVTYRQVNTMHVWTRPLEKFNDGRYELVKRGAGSCRDEVIVRDEQKGRATSHRRRVTRLPVCFAYANNDRGVLLDEFIKDVRSDGYVLRDFAPVQWHEDPSFFLSSDERQVDPEKRKILREKIGKGHEPEVYDVTVTVDVKVYQAPFSLHLIDALRAEDTQHIRDVRSGALEIYRNLRGLDVDLEIEAARRLAKHRAIVKDIEEILRIVCDAKHAGQQDSAMLELEDQPNKITGHEETFRLWIRITEINEDLFMEIKKRIEQQISSLRAEKSILSDGHLSFSIAMSP